MKKEKKIYGSPWKGQEDVIKMACMDDKPVLLTGSTGTGKELLTDHIQPGYCKICEKDKSRYEKVSIIAFAGTLLESELFGHVKNAFTGATKNKKGCIERADGGVVFLDEIGDLPRDLQGKLLRVIEAEKIRPVGSDTEKTVDVKFVAATDKPENIREELKYRFVHVIEIPPLSDNKSLLAEFIRGYLVDQDIKYITLPCLVHLFDYNWPGNVRELQSVLHRAVQSKELEGIGKDEAVKESKDKGIPVLPRIPSVEEYAGQWLSIIKSPDVLDEHNLTGDGFSYEDKLQRVNRLVQLPEKVRRRSEETFSWQRLSPKFHDFVREQLKYCQSKEFENTLKQFLAYYLHHYFDKIKLPRTDEQVRQKYQELGENRRKLLEKHKIKIIDKGSFYSAYQKWSEKLNRFFAERPVGETGEAKGLSQKEASSIEEYLSLDWKKAREKFQREYLAAIFGKYPKLTDKEIARKIGVTAQWLSSLKQKLNSR